MFKIREQSEEFEEKILSQYAQKASCSKGREQAEKECDIRTCFCKDRDKIIHSKAFRRLKHKTQVFFAPNNDHYRTRMTHTLEVSQLARTLAKALRLNEDLTEAISLGHDLGHTPFGHSGEAVLDNIMTSGFKHNIQSVRVARVLENLNLTKETLSGIMTHSWGLKPITLEAQVVQIADKVAYINHDIEDAIRAGIISENDIPLDCKKYLGNSKSDRIRTIIYDIINNSYNKNFVKMTEECFSYMNRLRDWMFEHVYTNSLAKLEEDKAKRIVEELFKHYVRILEIYSGSKENEKIQTTACDYISGMTDRYAVEKYMNTFVPKPLQTINADDYLFQLAKQNNL